MTARLRTALCQVVIALVASVGLQHASEAEDARRVVVEIQGSRFMPEKATVRAGDIVVWRNEDIVPHTATAKDGSWDSAMIPAGREWEMAVTEDTTLDYYCVFHPSMVAALSMSAQ